MKNTQKQRDKLGKILAERLEKPAKEDEKKHLKKELEDLADKIEQNEKDRQEERDKLDKTTRELEGLKKTFTLS